jgi:hypothetical protein
MVETIQKLSAFVGGFTGVSYEVDIDFENDEAIYIEFDYGLTESSRKQTLFTNDKKESFLENMAGIRILNWKERYERQGQIMDGTHWTIKIETHCRNYEFSGDNAYPKSWRNFCKQVEYLIDGRFE